MAQPNLRVVIPDQLHPRDLARREVKRFMLDREKDDRQTVCNQHTDQAAKQLWVDDVLERTERVMQEEVHARYRVNPIVVFWLIVGVIISLALVVVKSF